MKKLLFFIILMLSNYKSFAQQNIYFKEAKEIYDKHQEELLNEFRYRMLYANEEQKLALQKQFIEVSTKIDSARNKAYLDALIKTKVDLDLSRINKNEENTEEKKIINKDKEETVDEEATYPIGINGLRSEVSDSFYTDAITAEGILSTEVTFMVEKDGQITNVKASGTHRGFNIQAEIAIYLLSHRFSPAKKGGVPVRSRYRFPMKMRFE